LETEEKKEAKGMRRVVLLTALAALVSVIAVLRLVFSPASSVLPSSFTSDTTSGAYSTLPPSEQYVDLLRGRWERVPLESDEELERRYGPLGPACFIPPSKGNLTDEELWQAGQARRLEVSGWEWVPERGKMREWDVLRVLRRLLNSERGLVFVGDSITGQMAASLHSLLLVPLSSSPTSSDIPLLLPSTHRTGPPHNALTRLTLHLNPRHSLYTFLQRSLPLVPKERFAEPVFQFLRNDLLLPFRDLELLFVKAGVKGWVGEKAGFFAQQAWLASLTSPEQPARLWEGEQDSVLVINTGAHWTPDHFYMPGGEYVRGYAEMVRHLAPRLLGMPRLQVVYRTISPVHTDCHLSTSPVYPARTPDPERTNAAWGWDRFPELDTLWRSELDKLAPHGIGSAGGRVGWLNVTEMGGQRPEAHLLGEEGTDCMHWCGPAVPGEWVRMLWEMIEEG